MRQGLLFLNSFKKSSTWWTIFLTVTFFYILSVLVLRFDTIISLFSNLGFWSGFWSVFSLYTQPLDTFSIFSLITFLVTATLFALHIIALRLYTKKRFYTKGQHLSLLGIISSLVGCLACCGSVLIAATTAFVGVSLNWLPFGGQEIGFFGLILSLGALAYTVRKIDAPLAC